MIVALLPAAGMGSRMGGGVSKVWRTLEQGGEPILLRTVRIFLTHPRINHLVVVCRSEEVAAVTQLLAPWAERCTVTTGGATRQESVANGIEAVATVARQPESDIVLVHDAARCFVDHALIDRVIDGVMHWGAVTAAVPVVDTLVRATNEGQIDAPVPRSGVWSIQTPQGFRVKVLHDAHTRARAEGRFEFTDDANVVAPHAPVHCVLGSRFNIKVTVPEDLELAKAFLMHQANGPDKS